MDTHLLNHNQIKKSDNSYIKKSEHLDIQCAEINR